jgi:hypothetical protein
MFPLRGNESRAQQTVACDKVHGPYAPALVTKDVIAARESEIGAEMVSHVSAEFACEVSSQN